MARNLPETEWQKEWESWVVEHGNRRVPVFGRGFDGLPVRLHDTFSELHRPGCDWPSALILVAWLDKVHEAGSMARAISKWGVRRWNGGAYERIYALEDRIGKQVFLRNKRPFTLTPAGERLVRRYLGYEV